LKTNTISIADDDDTVPVPRCVDVRWHDVSDRSRALHTCRDRLRDGADRPMLRDHRFGKRTPQLRHSHSLCDTAKQLFDFSTMSCN
jgi:hypothetical protein